ncbi:hypothetical protein ACF073_21930 [Streptomyces sp. NPDC015171]|uniref:hypothetical protein n=1 Tax=Streptomyces sp. NPDC015171 TaxID=3364945 RepID=UPI0036FA2F5E
MSHQDTPYASRHLPDQTGFVWDFSGGRLVITGTCPACAGATRHPLPDVTPGAIAKGARRGSAADDVPGEVYMRCRCRLPHPGDEQETGGCGAKWVAVRPAGAGS